jgi:hypothetical protein
LKRIVIPVAAVAVLAIGGAWWLVLRNATRGEPQEVTQAATADGKSAPNAKTPSRPGPVPTGIARPVPAPASIALRDEIRDAADLRAYYERVKDLPDAKGERSYRLAEAIFECSIFVDKPAEELSRRMVIVPAKGDAQAQRNRLLNTLVERCKGFNGMGTGMLEITQQLHRRAESAGYPAEIARSLRFEPAVRDLPRADGVATQLLAANPDPEVLLQVHRYLDARNGTEWLRQFNTDVLTWSFGWGLLQCDYGADCGPRSRPVMMVCILRGACDVTRVEAVIFIQGGQAAVNGADNLRTQLAQRIANQDWAGLGFIERSDK